MLASQAQTLRCHHKPGFTSNSSARIPSYTGLWKASLPRRPGKALPTSFVFRSRRRLTCRALLEQEASNSSPKVSLFGREQQLSGPQKILEGLPAPARYVGSAAVVAGALAAGYLLGGRVPIGRYQGSQVAAVGGAVSLGVIGGATVFAFNAAAPQVAAVQLRNKLVNHSDPTSLTPTEIDEVGKKYGISRQNERFNAEIRDLYASYITGVIPPGNGDLKGDEVESIIAFKNALGLDDPDAAAMHIEVGRRLFRQRLEIGDREGAVEERRTFQKLVYVSTLVFGEASKFLLPWKRVFKVTDAQVDVAVRDNASRLFSVQLNSIGPDFDIEQIKDLRKTQLKLKLTDEVAAEVFRSHVQKQLEQHIVSAMEILKSRARIKDTTKIVRDLDNALAFNAKLGAIASGADANDLLPGIGPISVLGGQFESDRQMDDLKQLYRVFLTEAFAGGKLEDTKVIALGQLRNTFGMGKREAEDVMQEVVVKIYRRLLAKAVQNGDLEAAPSKAVFLQNLCDTLKFDPTKASQIHEEIYRNKLEQCVADGKLDDEDVKNLLRLRVFLCIPQDIVDSAHAQICGRIFTKVVDDAISAGIDGYDADMKAAVRNAATGLRLTQQAAMDIASKAVRGVFLTYVKRSRSAGSRVESARELKKMVIFSNIVVSELIADIKGDIPAAEKGETKEETKKDEKDIDLEDEEDFENIQSLKKTKPGAQLEGRMEKSSQNEITVRDELELRERTDLYRTYLIYCLSGETTGMPMGTQIVTQRDDTEFVRLGQLGQILGMTSKEVADVHKGLAEQAFSQQAKVILADGQLSKARMEQLTELQKQLGLPAESAKKVIEGITTTRMSGAIESAINQGRLNVEEVKELREAGVDIDGMIPKPVRQKLFKKVVDRTLSSGTGDFDEAELYEKLPEELGITTDEAKKMTLDLAKERLSNSLIQAVSLLRQKKPADVVSTLNNLLACDKVSPSPALSWAVKDELLDLFCIYVKDPQSDEKVSRLRELLGIDESQAKSLQEMVLTKGFSLGLEEEEFSF
ncbi:protein TIC110, chloroplastic [Physcomitrium patens]|uniref:Uncharacterized protein n=1 Tax=Physcomitrium patens TaxID=3218 RepID=A0A2K1J2Y7_PHYPA|nr:protein TIC110, chloroplastic-like [Physcomitrium patens]PNR35886.1 hypothetical protein PHYPA_021736 [Physcomitrium patens]|eukprot:XP_024401478.1 protein TIC110, chloroplastic-like [Physcomitrella patens]